MLGAQLGPARGHRSLRRSTSEHHGAALQAFTSPLHRTRADVVAVRLDRVCTYCGDGRCSGVARCTASQAACYRAANLAFPFAEWAMLLKQHASLANILCREIHGDLQASNLHLCFLSAIMEIIFDMALEQHAFHMV